MERKIQKLVNGEWEDCVMGDLRKDDVITLFEPNGDSAYKGEIWRCIDDPMFDDKGECVGVNAEMVEGVIDASYNQEH